MSGWASRRLGSSQRHTSPALAWLAAGLCLLALTGCRQDGTSSQPAPATSPDPVSIPVTIQGDSVTPNGERVGVAVGQAVSLVVTADAAGEIHVHSTPEQEFEYAAGTQTLELQPIAIPGIVDVESHTQDKIIVQLEVR